MLLRHRKCEGVHSDALFQFQKACCSKTQCCKFTLGVNRPTVCMCVCVLACWRTAVGIRRGRNRGREREGGTGQQLLQNRDSFTRHPTTEAAGAQEVVLHLHPHHFGFSFHKRLSIHLCDIVSGRSRCYWRLVGVEKKKGGLSSRWGPQWTAGPCLSIPDFVWTMNDREREKEIDRKETRVGKKKREREIDCTSVCSGLKQGLTEGMMLQLVVTRSQFLHHT